MKNNLKKHHQNIIFFDGVCGLCNGFVDFVLRNDSKKQFLFAPLQGDTFKKWKQTTSMEFPDSVVLLIDNEFSIKSTAALKILVMLGGWYSVANFFFIVPLFIRDGVYDFIARNRYGWFGKKESCRLPSPEERSVFLD